MQKQIQKQIQNLFNFVHDNLGKDNSIIGLCGLKKRREYVFINIPREFKKTCVQCTERNYLLL